MRESGNGLVGQVHSLYELHEQLADELLNQQEKVPLEKSTEKMYRIEVRKKKKHELRCTWNFSFCVSYVRDLGMQRDPLVAMRFTCSVYCHGWDLRKDRC